MISDSSERNILGSVKAILLVKRDDDLAVGVGLEGVGCWQLLTQDLEVKSVMCCPWSPSLSITDLVVVDLAVDSQSNALILVQNRLGASIDADNRQTLVHENGLVRRVVAAPIGSAVLDLLAHAQSSRAECLHIWVMVAGEDATHGGQLATVSGGVLQSACEDEEGSVEGDYTHQWATQYHFRVQYAAGSAREVVGRCLLLLRARCWSRGDMLVQWQFDSPEFRATAEIAYLYRVSSIGRPNYSKNSTCLNQRCVKFELTVA